MLPLAFEQITPTDDQIQHLYTLLSKRNHSISHQNMPSFEQHKGFVQSHPYRAWYLITSSTQPIGSVYVSNENSIGINLLDSSQTDVVKATLAFVTNNISPLPAIASVRPRHFVINVAPTNNALKQTLDSLNAPLIQLTYALNT